MKFTISELKMMAKGLRSQREIGHSNSLEILAKQLGFRNWNTLSAKAASNKPQWALGARVSGAYLGQAFEGKLVAVRAYGDERHHAITVQFDKPVEVAELGPYTATRIRVSAVIDDEGKTFEKTSNGKPHMLITLSTIC